MVHLLSVDYVEYLLSLILQAFKDNKVFFGGLELHNVDDLTIIGHLEGEIDLAQLAVKLFELNNRLLSVGLDAAFLI